MKFTASLDNRDFVEKINEIQASLSNVAANVEEQGKSMEQMFDSVTGKVAGLAAQFGLGFSAVGFVKQVASVRGEFQALEMSFNTLLGSEEKAADLMAQLTKTAAITPFDLQGVANGAKQLLAYGEAAEDVNDTIIQLGNIAAGMGLSIDYITQLYGTTVSKSHMDTMDLKQFKGQGIAIDEAIAEVMGIAKEKVAQAITNGEVTGDIVKAAISNLAGGTGKFTGMMENQSKTILGQISNLEDAIDSMFNEIGKKSQDSISSAISGVSYLVENYEKVGEEIGKLVVAYGAYKAALISISAFEGAGARQELETLKELTKVVEEQGDAELEELVKKGAITEAEANELLTLRSKIEAKREELELAKETAKTELEAAIQSQTIAQNELNAAKIKTLAAEESYELAVKSGNQTKIESAELALNTAANEENAAARRLKAAQTEVANKQTRLATAEEQINTLSINSNTTAIGKQTFAQKAHAFATNALATAQKGLKKALDATGLSMLANPYVAAAAAIAGLVYAIWKLTTATTEEEEAQKRLSDSVAKANTKLMTAKTALSDLVDEYDKAEQGTEEFKTAQENLIAKYTEFVGKNDEIISRLRTEKLEGEELKKVYNSITDAMYERYNAQAKEEFLKGEAEILSNANAEALKAIQKQKKEIEDTLYDENKDNKGYDINTDERYKKYKELYREVYGMLATGKNSSGNDVTYNEMRATATKMKSIWKDVYDPTFYWGEWDKEITDAFEQRRIYNQSKERANNSFGGEELSEEEKARLATEKARKEEEARLEALKASVRGASELAKQIEEADAKYEKFRKAVANGEYISYQVAGKEYVATAEYVETLKKAADDLKKEYKTLTKVEYDSISANGKAVRDAHNAQQLLRIQQEKDNAEYLQNLQYQIEEQNIAMAKNAQVKELRMRELNNKKAIDALKKEGEKRKDELIAQRKATFDEEQKAIAAEKNNVGEKYEVKSFDEIGEKLKAELGEGEYGEVDKQIAETIQRTLEIQAKEAQEAEANMLSSLADKYQDYEMQKTAISKKAEEERVYLTKKQIEATTDEAKNMYSNMIAKSFANEAKDIFNLDFSQFQGTDFYQAAFQDLESVGTETLNKLLEQFQQFGEKLPESMSPTDMKAFQDAMNNVKNELLDRDPFAALKSSIEEYRIAQSQLVIANDELVESQTLYDEALEEYRVISEDSAATEDDKANALNNVNKAYNSLDKATSKYIKAQNNIRKAEKNTKKAFDGIKSSLGKLFTSFTDLGNAIGGMTGEVIALTGEVGNSMLSIFDNVQRLGEITKSTSEQVSVAIKTVESASVILAIISAAIQIAQKIINLFHKDDQTFENLQKEYSTLSAILDNVIEKQKEIVELQYSTRDAAKSATDTIISSYEREISALQELGDAQMRDHGRREHSEAYKLGNFSKNELNMLSGVISDEGAAQLRQAQGVVDIFKLSAQDIAAIVNSTQGADFLKSVGYSSDTIKNLQDIADKYEAIGEAQDALIEKNAGMSFDDMYSSYIDSLTDMESSTEDFAANMEETLRNAIVQSMINEQFKDKFDAMYEELAEINNSKTSVSDEEYYAKLNEWKAKAAATYDEAAQQVEAIDAALDISNLTAQNQEATAGGFETMSEDTGTELSGRFTAMYMIQSEHLALAQSMAEALSGSVNILTMSNAVLEDMRSLQVTANDFLSNIAQNTRNIYASWNERIENIEKAIKSL